MLNFCVMLSLMLLKDSAEVQLVPLFENKADSQIQIDFAPCFFFICLCHHFIGQNIYLCLLFTTRIITMTSVLVLF